MFKRFFCVSRTVTQSWFRFSDLCMSCFPVFSIPPSEQSQNGQPCLRLRRILPFLLLFCCSPVEFSFSIPPCDVTFSWWGQQKKRRRRREPIITKKRPKSFPTRRLWTGPMGIGKLQWKHWLRWPFYIKVCSPQSFEWSTSPFLDLQVISAVQIYVFCQYCKYYQTTQLVWIYINSFYAVMWL